MLLLKKITGWLIFSVFIFILLGITYIIYSWTQCNCTEFNIQKAFSNEKDAKIAVFKPDTQLLPKIRAGRFLIREPFKYPFYSPLYYSDVFYIKFQFPDSVTFVVDDRDTVRWGDVYLIDTVPSRIKGYDYSGNIVVTYYQDTLFQSNIERKPVVPFFNQIKFGPTRDDCKIQCD